MVMVFFCTRGEIDFIDMFSYTCIIFNVHPLFFPVVTDFFIMKMSNVHDPTFLLLLESNMFHQVL